MVIFSATLDIRRIYDIIKLHVKFFQKNEMHGHIFSSYIVKTPSKTEKGA